MQEDKVEIPGEEDAQETIIDLDAPTPEQSLEEDIIDVEEISENDNQSNNAPAKSGEQSNVQADKAELGALAWQDGMLKLQADYYRLVEERAQSQDGMKMVSKMGLTSPLVTFDPSFPVSGQLTVPIIREERLLGIIETIRKVVLGQTTETGEFNKLFYGSA